MTSPPDLAEPLAGTFLVDAIIYCGQLGPPRKELRRLLREHDLEVAELLEAFRAVVAASTRKDPLPSLEVRRLTRGVLEDGIWT
jgi:hypothetical protein